jgi:hypothetical protein
MSCDRIYKFEDKQMKAGMTLGHKCFVTQFSTKEVLYYDDFWRTTESFYMACWIPISIIDHQHPEKLKVFVREKNKQDMKLLKKRVM